MEKAQKSRARKAPNKVTASGSERIGSGVDVSVQVLRSCSIYLFLANSGLRFSRLQQKQVMSACRPKTAPQ